MTYGKCFDKIDNAILECHLTVPEETVIQAGLDAVISYAIAHGIPEGEIEKLFQKAMQ